jgi:ankyrin repeat protein
MNRINLDQNNLPVVRRLLIVGADVNATTNNGTTPLHLASCNGSVQVVQLLLENGAEIEAKDNDGLTSLHWACLKGHLAVFNELLSRGADMEVKNSDGDTPLHSACFGGNLAIAKALLSCGADMLAANDRGLLPIHTAVAKGSSAATKYLLQQFYAAMRSRPLHQLVEDLAWNDHPDITVITTGGVPPLRSAFHQEVLGTDDVVEIVEFLVERNPQLLCSRDQDGSLPLHVACRRGVPFNIVQSLVNHDKASIKCLTPEGDLPLFLACEMSETSLDTIFLLMKLYPDLVHR